MAEIALSATEFKALSSKTRVDIIKLLAVRNHNLSEIAKKLGMSPPTIKQHISVLEGAGLIQQIESAHKWRYYTLSEKSKVLVGKAEASVLVVLAIASAVMLGLLYEFMTKFWIIPFRATEKVMEKMPGIAEITSADANRKISETAAQNILIGNVDFMFYIAVIIALAFVIVFCIAKMRRKPQLQYFVDKRNE